MKPSQLIIILATIFSASAALSAQVPAKHNEVFGLKVGVSNELPSCAFSTPDRVCLYTTYFYHEDGDISTPVYIPASQLPKYVSPKTVRVTFHPDGKLKSVRYVISNMDGSVSHGYTVYADLEKHYGQKHTKTGMLNNQFTLGWDYPDAHITMSVVKPDAATDTLATVTVSK